MRAEAVVFPVHGILFRYCALALGTLIVVGLLHEGRSLGRCDHRLGARLHANVVHYSQQGFLAVFEDIRQCLWQSSYSGQILGLHVDILI
jgi:hypothetical protein